MQRRMIRRSVAANRAVLAVATLFVAAAAALLSLSAILFLDLFGSIDRLMREAKTPHFMQMHAGALDRAALEAFAGEREDVDSFQIAEFLNVDGALIRIGQGSLAASVQDNGFCVQNERFDYLLDLDGARVQPRAGELYVPVCYLQDGTAALGDRAVVCGRDFKVAGFVRDSQMNSALASSKRFVVSEADYAALRPSGSVEYLIEFRLKDRASLGAFEAAYSAAGLSAGGPALTWPLFRLMSAISDGILIGLLLATASLVVLIALLCIRFTLLAKMEDDRREIGVLKAVGMRTADIQGLYMRLYGAVAAAGSALGFALSLSLKGPLQQGIRLHFGGGGGETGALALGAILVLSMFGVILVCERRMLRRFRAISAVQALRIGAGEEAAGGRRALRLRLGRVLSVNGWLGVRDVFARSSLYSTMLLVVVLSAFILIVPQNLYHTLAGEGIVAYMGVGRCDIRLDVQQTGQIEEKAAAVAAALEADPAIGRSALLTAKTFGVRLQDGSSERIRVELGDHMVFPLACAQGRMPASPDEIALSALNAEALGKRVGDRLVLLSDAGERELTVCGVYSDITQGGKTAKAVFQAAGTPASWCVLSASVRDPAQLAATLAAYARRFPFAKVSGIDEYVAQTFGPTLRSVRTAAQAAVLVAVSMTLLVTLLLMKLLSVKDRHAIAVLRAVGFTRGDIARQYAWRTGTVLAAGILLGTLLAGTLGEGLAGSAIAAFGAAAFRFSIDPWATYIFAPLAMSLVAFTATLWGMRGAGDVRLQEAMKE